MYDELIADLRRHNCNAKEDDTQEVCDECPYDVIIADKSRPTGITSVCVCGLMNRAADALEELSAFREQITDGHFYCMRDGVLYEAKVEPPKGKVFQLPPIVFVEEGE